MRIRAQAAGERGCAVARVDGTYVILSEVRATPERSRKIYVQ